MTAARLPRLDALRCVAVMLVIARHAPAPEPDVPGLLAAVLRFFHGAGWAGVDLFFVLSGFLVSGLLFREHRKFGDVSVKSFLIRRGLKIYPAFYIYTAVVIAAAVALHRPLTIGRVMAELLFVQNYLPGVWWGHTWSLAVEEHFYLLLAAAVWLIVRRAPKNDTDPFRRLIPAAAVTAVTCLGLRLVDVFLVRMPRDFFLTHLRIDSLMFGVLLSYAFHYRRETVERVVRRWGWIFVVCALAVIAQTAFLAAESVWMKSGGFTTLYLAFGAVVLVAVCRDEDRSTPAGWLVRSMARVGVYSYSIYLWHRATGDLATVIAQKAHIESFALQLLLNEALALPIGILAAKAIEMPVLRLRDRFFPSRSGPIG